MKRFLSLLIALVLVFSMFSVTAVAFANTESGDTGSGEASTGRTVRFDDKVFLDYVYNNRPFDIEMSKTFMFDGIVKVGEGENEKNVVWFKDSDILHKMFDGINYIELKDENIVKPKDDEELGDDVVTYNVHYELNLPEGVEASGAEEDEDAVVIPKVPEDKKYQATEHVTLADSLTLKGYTFAGWEVSFDGRAREFQEYIFAAGFKFNMPATEVTVKAVWKKVVSNDNQDGNDAAGSDEVTIPDVYANDLIYVLYNSSDSRQTMDKWERCLVTSNFSVTTKGWWNFRFAVADGIKLSEKDHVFDWDEDILVTTYQNVQDAIDKGDKKESELLGMDYTLRCYAKDTTHPQVKLSTTMEEKQKDGLTVGTTYSISTALTIEEAGSSTHVTYEVFKKVGTDVEGADKDGWLLIYASTTGEVTEGYEKYISTSGVITPREEDITGDYVYKIVYSVVDDFGYFGVDEKADSLEEYKPKLLLKVYAEVVEPGAPSATEIWKIVLYVVAGLSAVGIVVLLCIKPKQAEAQDARYNAKSNEAADGSSDGDETQE
ncbi:MAG: hypothetical protein J1F68_01135 [Clostridiales bacterium]|nr:hypothetical protein [Clostridiales bacterium]